jgi:hypothetical protein
MIVRITCVAMLFPDVQVDTNVSGKNSVFVFSPEYILNFESLLVWSGEMIVATMSQTADDTEVNRKSYPVHRWFYELESLYVVRTLERELSKISESRRFLSLQDELSLSLRLQTYRCIFLWSVYVFASLYLSITLSIVLILFSPLVFWIYIYSLPPVYEYFLLFHVFPTH